MKNYTWKPNWYATRMHLAAEDRKSLCKGCWTVDPKERPGKTWFHFKVQKGLSRCKNCERLAKKLNISPSEVTTNNNPTPAGDDGTPAKQHPHEVR